MGWNYSREEQCSNKNHTGEAQCGRKLHEGCLMVEVGSCWWEMGGMIG